MRTTLLVAALLCVSAGSARAITVDEIVNKHIAARGGLDKLRALRSLRLTGKSIGGTRGSGNESEWGQLRKRPAMIREETTLQGLTQVQAHDGKEGWSVEPFGGRRDAERKSADESKRFAQLADFDGPLVDAKAKGHQLEYLGTEDIDGTEAHKLRVTLKDGDSEMVYLDPDAFLVIRTVHIGRVRGTERVIVTDYGSYEQVAGVWIPFAIESGLKDSGRVRTIRVEKAEPNVDADDALFHFPPGGRTARAIVAGPGAAGPAATSAAPPPGAERPPTFDSGVLSGLEPRNIGSATMSGRVSAVTARTDQGMTTIFVGAASGGVWKSIDSGTTFKPVFDKEPVQSIGAIALDPQDPRTVWVGTGESWMRNSVSIGDGIYKSTDGGETWTHMGLPESEHIVRIIVHPKNGKVVYACAPGKLWSDSPDRGLYKTTDGGATWTLVLKGPNLSTGCSSLAMDPANPDKLFAGMWDFRRKGWTFRSGGESPTASSGSGLFTSTDGGKSWTPVQRGLPEGPWGRVEVAVAPSDGKVVYALIEGVDSALYRSADGGATWEARDKSRFVVWRPFYFARLIVDPTKPDRLFKPGGTLVVSDDGGRSFASSGGEAHGDWHDVWIDPANPRHIVGGDDGGLWISQDGGTRWWKVNNLPISQFYHVSLDDKDPYHVFGGLQDNGSWVGDSAYPSGITNSRWENLYGGDGFVTVVDGTDPEAVYSESQGGTIGRVDRRTLASRDIQPQAGYKEKLRWNWNTPIQTSPTKKGTLYIGAQFLFRSRDRGDTWERISPDLTTNDPEKQKQEQSGGVTVDNSAAEMHTTIYAIAESPLDARVIWVGTDDGNVQLTRDGGKHWENVAGNVTGLPPASWVSFIEPSRTAAGTAYATFDRHTFGDMTPWVWKTTDFGKSWTRLAGDEKGVRGYAHVIKEDPVKPALLFLGTELGLWVSIDAGASWAEVKGHEFPSVAVREMRVHPRDGDLVIATHGRGIWIIDDLTPLRALSGDVLSRPVAFLPARPQQQRMNANGGGSEGDAVFTGDNPAQGAVITYYQRARHIFGPMKLEILDAAGKVVDTITPSKRRGVNRVTWTTRMKPPRVPPAAQVAFSAASGPRVLPGTYTARLTRGAEVVDTKLVLALDRRAPYTLADRKANLDAALRAHALFGDMSSVVDRINAAASGARARQKALPAGDALAGKLGALADALEAAKRDIVATKEGGAITGEERIREHLESLYGALLDYEGRPARYQLDRIEALRRELDDVRKKVDEILARDLPPLDEELKAHKLEAIPRAASIP